MVSASLHLPIVLSSAPRVSIVFEKLQTHRSGKVCRRDSVHTAQVGGKASLEMGRPWRRGLCGLRSFCVRGHETGRISGRRRRLTRCGPSIGAGGRQWRRRHASPQLVQASRERIVAGHGMNVWTQLVLCLVDTYFRIMYNAGELTCL